MSGDFDFDGCKGVNAFQRRSLLFHYAKDRIAPCLYTFAQILYTLKCTHFGH